MAKQVPPKRATVTVEFAPGQTQTWEIDGLYGFEVAYAINDTPVSKDGWQRREVGNRIRIELRGERGRDERPEDPSG